MKRILSVLAAVLLTAVCLCGGFSAAANATLTAKASASSVTIGNSVTVTVTCSGGETRLGAMDGLFRYNAETFEYVSSSGDVEASGNAGVIRLSWFAPDVTAPTSISFSLTLRAKAAGDGGFSAEITGVYSDADNSSLGTPSQTVAVSAINPTLSANANLSALKPSSGTLTPKFSASVTSYTIEVPYATASLSLSATTADSGARTAVSGSNKLAVGKNTQVITVTAPNGTTKKYTVVINRAAAAATSADNGTTTAPVVDNPLEVSVDGVLMTVLDTQPDIELPAGFVWGYASLNGVDISAARNETTGLTLVCLKNESDGTRALWLYEETAGQFSAFRPLTVSGGLYVLRDMPAETAAPAGTVAGEHIFGDKAVPVFTYEDAALADYCIVWAVAPDGRAGLYTYDSTDNSLQRYHEVTVTQTVEAAPTGNAFTRFMDAYGRYALILATVLVGVALLTAVIVWVIRLSNTSRNCKH